MRLQRITAVAHPAGNRVDLTWVHPDPAQFPGVCVVRREGTHPTTPPTPQPGSPVEGIVVADTDPTSPDQRMVEIGEDGLYHVIDAPLKGETVYYYALFPYRRSAGEPRVYDDPDPYNRTAAMTSAPYNMAGQLAELLPTIYHRYDTVLSRPDATVADADRHKGQLRRFLELPGSQLDQLYSFARAMLDLHNLDKVDGRLLPLLAQWIGWQTDFQLDIAAQRNEIKFAPHLYRSVGTAPNLQTLVYHYTGWHTQIAEFVQHIARSNLPAQLNIFAITESTSGWSAASLVTLEGAPRGRLSAFVDDATRIRLFYETADLQAVGMEPAAAVRFVPQQPQGRLRYKTFRNGAWAESQPLLAPPEGAQGDPAAVELPPSDGSRPLWLAWIDNPHTNAAQLRFARGTAGTPQPARLQGQRSEPFRIVPGTHLLLRGNWPETESVTFTGRNFPDPQQATAAQVEAVLKGRLTHVTASAQPNGTLLLSTVEAGGDARLELDIQHSSAAAALGFNANNATAFGDAGDSISWQTPQDVTAAPAGYHADLHALVAADGDVWLFWAMHVASNWHIVSARWDSETETWSPLMTIANGLGGNREPWAVLDQTDRIWVFWSRRQGVGTVDDIWTLRRCVFDPATGPQDAEEVPVTTPPSEGRAADREPGVVRLSNGDLRVFFRSDRAGGPDLWSLTVRPPTGEEVRAPSAITADAAANHAPAPLLLGGDTLWLLYRSDRSVPLARVATSPLQEMETRVTSQQPAAGGLAAVPLRSTRIVDTGTLRRFAGSTSLVLGDAARLSRHRLWDDLLAYTPQKPRGPAGGEVLQDDDLYTRGTVGLYVSQVLPDTAYTRQKIEQLRLVLARFLPINVRVVVILVPVDRQILHANIVGQVSADPANLTSLQWRAYFPEPL